MGRSRAVNEPQAKQLIADFFQQLGVSFHPQSVNGRRLRYSCMVDGSPVAVDFIHTEAFALTSLCYRGPEAAHTALCAAAMHVFPLSEKKVKKEAEHMEYGLRDLGGKGARSATGEKGSSEIRTFGFEGELRAVQYLQETFGQVAQVEHHNTLDLDANLSHDISLHFRHLTYFLEVKASNVGRAEPSAKQWKAHRDVRTHLFLEVHPSSFRMVKLPREECERHLRKL